MSGLGYVRRIASAALVALLLTLASIYIERTRLEVQDWDCPPPPLSCARPVVVGGFPLPFVSDYHGLSVVGSVSLDGLLMGEDNIHWAPFLADYAIYLLLYLALLRIPLMKLARND